MRYFYNFAVHFLVPLVLLWISWRGVKQPAYWQRWAERFGFGDKVPPAPGTQGNLWIHAVSMGEAQAAIPLIRALQATYPQYRVVVTTMTPTGSALVTDTFGDSVYHCYVPYDLSGNVKRFYRRIQPVLGIILETELWPNLFYYAGRDNVPLLLASARISPSSQKRYRLIPGPHLGRQMFAQLVAVAAQTEEDKHRLIELGANPKLIEVLGNLKFDLSVAPDLHARALQLRQSFGIDRPVWIAASTHEGEEEAVLRAFKIIQQTVPNALLVIVPRHPERFASVASLCRKHAYNTVLRSSGEVCTADTAVFVGDTMGELMLFYAAADVAFVGGSLAEIGGHNVLEPAALAIPAVVGPHTYNCQDIVEQMQAANALQVIQSADELVAVTLPLLTNQTQRQSMGRAGQAMVAQNRGSLAGVMSLVAAHMPNE